MNLQEPINGAFFNPVKGVYKITNTVTGRVYIGQSMETQSRISSHFKDLARECHISQQMQSDWKKYGPDSFTAEIVEAVRGKDQRLIKEAEIIAEITASGIEVYNTSIHSPESIKANIEARDARKAAVAKADKERQAALRLKKQAQVKDNGQTEARSHPGSQTAATRKNNIFRGRPIPRPESVSPLASDQQKLRVQEADLFPSQKGVDTTAETERPPAASVDEDGQYRESYGDIPGTLSRSGYYIPEEYYKENELGEYLGCNGVDRGQWETDIRLFREGIERDIVNEATLAWFLRTYIRHDILFESVKDIDQPFIYWNLSRGPEWIAEIIRKHMPEFTLAELE